MGLSQFMIIGDTEFDLGSLPFAFGTYYRWANTKFLKPGTWRINCEIENMVGTPNTLQIFLFISAWDGFGFQNIERWIDSPDGCSDGMFNYASIGGIWYMPCESEAFGTVADCTTTETEQSVYVLEDCPVHLGFCLYHEGTFSGYLHFSGEWIGPP
jgi:hypothetical protein